MLLVALGCSSTTGTREQVCTAIGCDSGLAVRVEGASTTGAYRVELLPSGETGPRYVAECPDASRCAAGVRFPGFTGDWTLVRVTTAQGTVTREVRPSYQELRPNGPDCPPICRQAVVTVSVLG